MPKHYSCLSLMRGVYKGKDAEGLQGITLHFTESGKDGAALRQFPSILKRRAWAAASFHRFFVLSRSSSISIEASSSIRACVCSTASSGAYSFHAASSGLAKCFVSAAFVFRRGKSLWGFAGSVKRLSRSEHPGCLKLQGLRAHESIT